MAERLGRSGRQGEVRDEAEKELLEQARDAGENAELRGQSPAHRL